MLDATASAFANFLVIFSKSQKSSFFFHLVLEMCLLWIGVAGALAAVAFGSVLVLLCVVFVCPAPR